jgi:hypothetical protein
MDKLSVLGDFHKGISQYEKETESLKFYQEKYVKNPTPALARIIEKQKTVIRNLSNS